MLYTKKSSLEGTYEQLGTQSNGEAFLRKYEGDAFEPYTAGLEPKVVNSLTEEVRIDISNQRSKGTWISSRALILLTPYEE